MFASLAKCHLPLCVVAFAIVCGLIGPSMPSRSFANNNGDATIASWTFDDRQEDALTPELAKTIGSPEIIKGPSSPDYPVFENANRAMHLDGQSHLRYADPGTDSQFDFGLGDEITLEAWIRPRPLADGQQVYLIGKGRTLNPNVAKDNQNWSLRLRGMGGTSRISFLFRGEASDEEPVGFHRWNSSFGISSDQQWHHIAVQFRFGDASSIAGFIDGRQVPGTWDMGKRHDVAPVQDNDEIWLGSSLGGQVSSSYRGDIDEVAIHRTLVTAESLSGRYESTLEPSFLPEVADHDLGTGVVAEILEGLADDKQWYAQLPWVTERFPLDQFALTGLPSKYNDRAVRVDRASPFLLRLRARGEVPSGGRGILRAKNATRLWIDDVLVAETSFMRRNASGHEAVPELKEPPIAGMHPVGAGHQEVEFKIPELASGPHTLRVETYVGGQGVRTELGDLCVAFETSEDHFVVWAPESDHRFKLTSGNWLDFDRHSSDTLRELDRTQRQLVDAGEREYWQRRHEIARKHVDSLTPLNPPSIVGVSHPIDAWIRAELDRQGIQPTAPLDDLQFLRRLFLDTVGVPPTNAELESLLRDESPQRREHWIDRLLADDRWADHWVGYWQDVLAENPGILKPQLNNTGPFRYWIYESFLDNKPIDRFVTELIRMEGSRLDGGPAGFGMASQNDVPMAAKGMVISTAFLGINMSCARCHDAPDRDSTQEDLFSLAALLNRGEIKLPKTSTVPLSDHGRQPAITVSLKPGTAIRPAWPFDAMGNEEQLSSLPLTKLIEEGADSRERLAAMVTTPANQRFAQVIANRLWARLIGRGIVPTVDDWEASEASHPELLEWLGRTWTRQGYDLKALARIVMTSELYQSQATEASELARWFAGPTPRRLTAEQFVDSLYSISGKTMGWELLTLDPEGRRPASTFLNLGLPRRAWNYTSLSNERDRPALALPVAQGVVDLLVAFGWRDSRPNPRSDRDHSAHVLQPLIVAHGDAAHRLTQFSEDSWFTQLSLDAESPQVWLHEVFLRILGRYPTPAEQADLLPLVADGFSGRTADANARPVESTFRNAVSWSNHLHPDATSIKLALEEQARVGDPPTLRLQPEWREQAEDIVWVLMNSPELLFVP